MFPFSNRILGLCVVVAAGTPLLVSCKGPMHLLARDYDTGLVAFEALEHKLEASDREDSEARDHWENLYRSKLFRDLSTDSPAFDALVNFDFSVSLKGLTRSEIAIARMAEHRASSSPGEAAAAREKSRVLTERLPEVEAVVKLCHDDAARYFHLGVAASTACAKRLAPLKKSFHAEHPDPVR